MTNPIGEVVTNFTAWSTHPDYRLTMQPGKWMQ
jgi:hypothetical protein